MKKIKLISSLSSVAVVSAIVPLAATSCSNSGTRVIEYVHSTSLDVEKEDTKPTICMFRLDPDTTKAPVIVSADADYDKTKVEVESALDPLNLDVVIYTLKIADDAEVVSGDKTRVTFKFKDTNNNDYSKTIDFTFTDHDFFLFSPQRPEITYQYCARSVEFFVCDFNATERKEVNLDDLSCEYYQTVFSKVEITKGEEGIYLLNYQVKPTAQIGSYTIKISYETPYEKVVSLDVVVYIKAAEFEIGCKFGDSPIEEGAEVQVDDGNIFTFETVKPLWDETTAETKWYLKSAPANAFYQFGENENEANVIEVKDKTQIPASGYEIVVQLQNKDGTLIKEFKFKVSPKD